MKIIQNNENPNKLVTTLVPEDGERSLSKWFFYRLSFIKDYTLEGELIIPEGIGEIEDMAFNHLGVSFKTFRFPKSLARLGESVISGYSFVEIFYPGSSEDFKSIAKIREESEYVSGGYDHYPYYGGGGWVTHYYCFDGLANSVEVHCEEDGVTLLYGTHHRSDGNPPKAKAE